MGDIKEIEFEYDEIDTFIKENGQTYEEILAVLKNKKHVDSLLEAYHFKFRNQWFPLRSPKWETRQYEIAKFLRMNPDPYDLEVNF